MGPPRAQWAPTGTHWRVTTVTWAVDELSLTLVPVLVGGGGQVLGDTGASGQPFLGPNSQGPCAVSACSRRACLLTVLGAGGRCSGARVGLVMAGVGPLWREIGGQEDVRGASEHRQALFLVPRGACGPGGAAGAEGGACYVRQVRAWGGGNNRVAVTVAGPGQPPHMRWAGGGSGDGLWWSSARRRAAQPCGWREPQPDWTRARGWRAAEGGVGAWRWGGCG